MILYFHRHETYFHSHKTYCAKLSMFNVYLHFKTAVKNSTHWIISWNFIVLVYEWMDVFWHAYMYFLLRRQNSRKSVERKISKAVCASSNFKRDGVWNPTCENLNTNYKDCFAINFWQNQNGIVEMIAEKHKSEGHIHQWEGSMVENIQFHL